MTRHDTADRPGAAADTQRCFAVRHRRRILVLAAVLVPLAAVIGANVARSLSVGGFVPPDSEYEVGRRVLTEDLRGGTANFIVLVSVKGAAPRTSAVDEDVVRDAGLAVTDELRRQPGVLDASSYWTLGQPAPLRSNDGTQALVLALISGDDDAVRDTTERLSPLFTRDTDVIVSRVGGAAEVNRQTGKQAESDLHKAELIAAPFTFIALLIVFRGWRAALLPLVVAASAVTFTFVMLRALSTLTDVSIFSLNLTTALGLGLAIDYSLFILSRYREERALGRDLDLALRRTLRTAGRTVVFSSGTVAVALASLLVFPMAYLRSYAYAGIATVAFAAIASLTVLPALIAVLGDRVGLPRPRAREGFWGAQARRVMGRPVLVSAAVIGVLIFLGLPFAHLRFGLFDDRVVPPSVSSRAVNDEIRMNFATREADATAVVVLGIRGDDPDSTEIPKIARQLATVAGVGRVDALTGHYTATTTYRADATSQRFASADAAWLSIVPSAEAVSPESEQMVRTVRHLDLGERVLVTGPTARFIDSKDAVTSRLPLALSLIGVATILLLFAMLGSVVVPLKAILLNALSLTATFGSMVWIFQDGHLTSWLDVTATGSIDVFTPILMFCIAFGLSMDYEVFLLSRIKEEYDLTGDNTEAIAVGLDHTGRLVTAAAILLAIVFIAFMTSSVSIVKLVGLGLTLAVLMDAFLIRATLVPAMMRLAGRGNWWAPGPLRRLHLRFGIWEREPSSEMDRVRGG